MAHGRAPGSTGEANTVGDGGEVVGTAMQTRRDPDPTLRLPNWKRRVVPGTPVRVVTQSQRDEPCSSKNSDIPDPESDKRQEEQDVAESEGDALEAICEKIIVKTQTKWMVRTLSTVKANARVGFIGAAQA